MDRRVKLSCPARFNPREGTRVPANGVNPHGRPRKENGMRTLKNGRMNERLQQIQRERRIRIRPFRGYAGFMQQKIRDNQIIILGRMNAGN